MSTAQNTAISIQAIIDAPIEKVWHHWTSPDSIKAWNQASDDWHTTRAENDLRKGGRFMSRMEAKDGSFGFDFEGIYDEVKTHELISYSLGDNRTVKIVFTNLGQQTRVDETFDAENTNPIEMQRNGWQAILNNFKKFVETSY
ncbi:MAG: SRPBCC family protein [Bacteroidales bacterium]